MAEKIEDLVKSYGDGIISRREFIQKGAVLTGSMAASAGVEEMYC